MSEVAGIVLGAGGSRRLGRPKQTLPFGDTTLLGHVVRSVEASSLDPLVLVVNETFEPPAVSRAVVVGNDSYGTGCASSLLAGLDSVGQCDAVMLLLGDMPGVDAAVIGAVRAEWEARTPWMALTSWRGDLGHPFVFSAAAFPELRALKGDKAVWKLAEERPSDVHRVPVDRALPLDVDTWDDYEAAQARFASGASRAARSASP